MRNSLSVRAVAGALLAVLSGGSPLFAQSSGSSSEIETLRQELRRLQERLQKLEEAQRASPPATAAPAAAPSPAAPPAPIVATPPVAPRPGEAEVSLERENIVEVIGLPKPVIPGLGTKFSGFFVGSFSYNSGLQIVPEAFGGTPAQADAKKTNFRFDKFSLGVSQSFASWLSASAAFEVESHRDVHSHIVSNGTLGCTLGLACERFGAEAPETVINLDKFDVTVVAPIGNGLRLSLGRFDVPFGIERHDENQLLTATTSEVFRFGRPQKMTGFQAAYAFAPWLDVAAWVVNRWESENTGEEDFNDNNGDKSAGGRIGFTPVQGAQLLNFGIGGWWGSERNTTHHKRWVLDLDFTWSPSTRALVAGEFVYGGEEKMATLRQVGQPVAEPLETNKSVNWWGFYLVGHYDFVRWAGLTFRYGFFDDSDRGRTGVSQTLQSFTFTPTLHLSALIPNLRPMGVTTPRSRLAYHWVDLKLEYRLNLSSRRVFGEAPPNQALIDSASDVSHQIQVQAVVNF
jgi:Putative beta-barrel porin-2, OmpL-like. bbp2